MVPTENCNDTLSSDTAAGMKPIFSSLTTEKNVTTLEELVVHGSQELCDLHRKASNLDDKTVGGWSQ